jgi:hypothetical protein
MTKKWPVIMVIIILAATQFMCVFGTDENSNEQMTAVAGGVEKTVESLKKTANPTQLVFPTVDKAFEETSIAIQTSEPSSGLSKPTRTMVPTQLVDATKPGSIGGHLSYPSETIPPLTIAAFRENNGSMTGEMYLLNTQQDQNSYQIEGLPAGKYYVVAYLRKGTLPGIDGLAGGFSKYIMCGATSACVDHSLVEVEVFPGTMTGEINPQDWYAPENTFPSEPTK